MYSTQDALVKAFYSPQILPSKKKVSPLSITEKTLVLIEWLEEHKAQNVLAFNVMNKNLCMDVVIIVTATSSGHAKGLADGILEECTKHNYEFFRMEGYQNGQWILVDLNEIVINIFQATTRELYGLETLWKGCSIIGESIS